MLVRHRTPNVSVAAETTILGNAEVTFYRVSNGSYYADVPPGPALAKARAIPSLFEVEPAVEKDVADEIAARVSASQVVRVPVEVHGGGDADHLLAHLADLLGGRVASGAVVLDAAALGLRVRAPAAASPSGAGAPIPPGPFKSAGAMMPTIFAAISNGWEADMADLHGYGEAALRADCVRSRSAGLLLSEMALIRAPEGWPAKRATAWPWEVEGFQGLPGWKAPAVPPKVVPADRPMGAPVEAPAPAPDAEAAAPTPPAPPLDDLDRATLASWSAPEVDAAAAFIGREIRGGNLLSPAKYNALAAAAGLRKVNPAQFSALRKIAGIEAP